MIKQTEKTKTTQIFNEFSTQVGEMKTTYKRMHNGVKIHSSKNAADLLRIFYADDMDSRENFRVIYLQRNNTVICTNLIGIGAETSCVASTQEIIRGALLCKAQAIILSHNHPSGETKPSQADKDMTDKIKAAAKFFDIAVLDHVILTSETYFSFADEGLL